MLRRFNEIDGGNQAAILSVTLFTTVLPLIILGFGYFSGFANNISIGVLFERQVGLSGAMAQTVRDAFGSADALRSSWTVVGLAGFLVWGIPMAVTVAAIFAAAWRRDPMTFWQRLWRCTLWFACYMVTLALHDRVAFSADHSLLARVALFTVSLVPIWLFWTLTPALLVRDGARGARFLMKAGLAGVVINGIVLSLALRVVFPPLLSGLTAFGPMGVAMAIVTWCGVIGMAWVATACVGAVWWEAVSSPGNRHRGRGVGLGSILGRWV